jgi:inhibitor of KinA sporulation pathway (predicted exonuclease)
MDIDLYDYFLIVDLEATCCDQQTIPRHEMETIEIGAVIVESSTLKTVDEFCTFIRPERHPQLTSFCQQLTSISQKDVDAATNFPKAILAFKDWLYQYSNFVFCSWGDYDKHQLLQDSQFHSSPMPIGAEHINIKRLFSKSQGLTKKYGMAGALKLAEMELEGTHHRGIDDARNMARLMPFILGKEQINSGES